MLEWILPILVIVVLGALVLWFFGTYNSLVKLRNRIDNAWSQIDVQLKKRADLVPNLVKTVKGYAKHEKTVFENVTKARAALMSAQGVKEKAQAENMLTGALKSLFAVSENYPDLKANEQFKLLMEQLDGVESKIAYARQFFNDATLKYNNSIEVIPNNFVAGIMGYKELPYFETDEASREPVKVEF